MNHIIKDPAVRIWIYGIFVAAGALAVGYGLVTAEQSGLWLSLIGAVLMASNGLAAANTPKREAQHRQE